MALRILGSTLRQTNAISRVARLSTTAASRKAVLSETIPTDLEQATGVERKEMEAIMGGNPDPFNMNITKGSPGTRDVPTLVPSMYDERIIGCVCEEESTSIVWMVLKKGGSQRCKCGNFFQLITGKTNALAD